MNNQMHTAMNGKYAFNHKEWLKSLGIEHKSIETYTHIALEEESTAGEIFIYDAIVDETTRAFWQSFAGVDTLVSATSFNKQLKQADGQVHVRINTPGGLVSEASAIYNLLTDFEGEVKCTIDGACHSAGTIIVLAAEPRFRAMADLGTLYFHKPLTMAAGNATDLQKTVDTLNTTQQQLAQLYAKRSDLTVDEANNLMNNEAFLNRQESKSIGFITNKLPAKITDENSCDRITANNLDRLNYLLAKDCLTLINR